MKSLHSNRKSSSLISVFLVFLLVVPVYPAQQVEEPPFKVRILEGDGAINDIRQVLNRAASIVVEDDNHNPLSGVSVTFFLPNDGPSGLFSNGSRVLTVFTDSSGTASSRPIHFNNQIGIMKINVVASVFSQTVSATIMQTNISANGATRSSFVPATGAPKLVSRSASHKKLYIVLGIVATGAAAGVFLATRKTTPTASVSVGAPTAGQP